MYYFGMPIEIYPNDGIDIIYQADQWGELFALIDSLTQESNNFFPGGLSTNFGRAGSQSVELAYWLYSFHSLSIDFSPATISKEWVTLSLAPC